MTKFAVRADHDARVYEVYEVTSGETIKSFPYRGKESDRGVAHGRANAARDAMNRDTYQPKTGERCHCKPGVHRDNCPECEGTGMRIDFRAIRARRAF